MHPIAPDHDERLRSQLVIRFAERDRQRLHAVALSARRPAGQWVRATVLDRLDEIDRQQDAA